MLYVIGSTGYIGKRLVEKNKKATPIYVRLEKDLSDYDISFINSGDVVAFCASISEPSVCAQNYELAKKVNVDSTSFLIKKFIERGCKVIFLSSDATLNMTGVYSKMKSQIDDEFKNEKLFKSLRLSYVMSKEDRFTKYLISCAENNKVADVFHPLCRYIVHREDVVDAITSLANNWNVCDKTIINCAGPKLMSRLDFVEILKKEIYPNLQYTITRPDDSFYLDRPSVIEINSPDLETILGRKVSSLQQSILLEFKK